MGQTTYVWDKSKRQFSDFIPPVSILIAGVIFILGTLWAVIDYRTVQGNYNFFDQFFSELGVRKDFINDDGESVFSPNSPNIFNFSLILSGFIMIPFFPFTYRQMRNRSSPSKFFFLVAIILGAFIGPTLIFVGLIDLSVKETSLFTDHHFWAALLYLMISVVSILWIFGISFSKDLPYRKSKLILLDYLIVFILLVNVAVSLLDNFKIILVEDLPYFNNYPIEAYQKFMAYLFFFYYALIVGIRLSLVKYDNTPTKVAVHDGEFVDTPKSRRSWLINELILIYLLLIIIFGFASLALLV